MNDVQQILTKEASLILRFIISVTVLARIKLQKVSHIISHHNYSQRASFTNNMCSFVCTFW